MTKEHFLIVLVVLLAAGLGSWLANADKGPKLTSQIESPGESTVVLPLAPSELPSLEVSPAPLEKRGTEQKVEKLNKLKSVIDRQRQVRRNSIPWLTTEKEAEKFGARVWEAKRLDYLSLFNDWNLSSEEIAKVENVLSSKEILMAKVDFKMDSTRFLSEESDALKQEANRIAWAAGREVASVIGEARATELSRWEDSRRERRTVERTAVALEKVNPLTEAQQQSVVDILYQEKHRRAAQTGEALSYFTQAEEYRKSVLEQLNKVLKPDQLQALEQALKVESTRLTMK